MPTSTRTHAGFTLLLTIIIIGVVLAVSLSSLSLAVKQVRLSADTRNSEVAFHAASAGLECIRYQRRMNAHDFENGNDGIEINCFGQSNIDHANRVVIQDDDDGAIYLYEYQIEWSAGTFGNRCSQMRFIVMSVPSEGDDLTLNNVSDYLAGYPGDQSTKRCEPAGLCTLFSSQGYSAGCPSTINGSFPIGTIQREIFVEF